MLTQHKINPFFITFTNKNNIILNKKRKFNQTSIFLGQILLYVLDLVVAT